MTQAQDLGSWGEEEAARYLQGKGLRLIDRHYQTRWGEVDLIFRDRDTIVFVEVKTRLHAHQPSALDALTPAKQKKVVSTALSYMKMKRLAQDNMRFDVVVLEAGRIEWIPGAFEASLHYTR